MASKKEKYRKTTQVVRPRDEDERGARSEHYILDVDIPGKRRQPNQRWWKDACKRDMTEAGLKEDKTINRAAWRKKTMSYTTQGRWRIFTLAGYQDQRCLVPTNSGSTVVGRDRLRGIWEENSCSVRRGCTNPLPIYKIYNFIRNLDLGACTFCRLSTRYMMPLMNPSLDKLSGIPDLLLWRLF